METFKTVVLVLSSLALFYASSSRLFKPESAIFLQLSEQSSKGIYESKTELLSEIRGVGSVMLIAGIVIMLSVFMPSLRSAALLLASVIFIGVVVGRLVSIGLDGMPNEDVLKAAIAELVLSLFNAHCMLRSFSNRENGSVDWFQRITGL